MRDVEMDNILAVIFLLVAFAIVGGGITYLLSKL